MRRCAASSNHSVSIRDGSKTLAGMTDEFVVDPDDRVKQNLPKVPYIIREWQSLKSSNIIASHTAKPLTKSQNRLFIMCGHDPYCAEIYCCCCTPTPGNSTFFGWFIRSCFCGLFQENHTWPDWYEVYSGPRPQDLQPGFQNAEPQAQQPMNHPL